MYTFVSDINNVEKSQKLTKQQNFIKIMNTWKKYFSCLKRKEDTLSELWESLFNFP